MLLRKNIELIINSLRQLNTYNLENFFAVNFKKTKIGWINSENKKLLEVLFNLKLNERLILSSSDKLISTALGTQAGKTTLISRLLSPLFEMGKVKIRVVSQN